MGGSRRGPGFGELCRRGLREGSASGDEKFVITESEAWFFPLKESETDVPMLHEILLAITGLDAEDDAHMEDADAKLEDERWLLGYKHADGQVEIHTTADLQSPVVRARLREVFGHDEAEGIG